MAAIAELIARATVAHALTIEGSQPEHETALQRIAAVGAGALEIATGADREGVPAAGSRVVVHHRQPARRDVLEAELAPLIWRVRYAMSEEMLPQAARLLADWLCTLRAFRDVAGPEHERLRLAFAKRVLHEAMRGRCPYCGGSGKQERTADGRLIRPRGAMQRNAIFAPCRACHGCGRAPISHVERRIALGISAEDYDLRNFPQRFNLVLGKLDSVLSARAARAVKVQLERAKRSNRW